MSTGVCCLVTSALSEPEHPARRPAERELRLARSSVAITFFVYGCVLATWVSRLPGVKHNLRLDSAELGLALAGAPAGLILAMRSVPYLVDRWTSAVVTRAAALAVCICLPLLSVAWDLVSLLGFLLLFGLTLGTLDITMNTQGVAVERAYGRPIMSGLHGVYSLGVLAGALCGSIAAHAGATPGTHFLIAAVSLAGLVLAGTRWLLGRKADVATATSGGDAAQGPPARRHAARWFLLGVGLVAFCSLFAEGAVDDWSGVYLHEVQRASFGVAPLGAAACGAGMTVGRLCGDRVIARYGRTSTLWRTSVVASSGMTLAVLAPTLGLAIAGYGILGLGVATIVPIAFTLAGNTQGVAPALALSRVTTLGYAGLFGSPTIIGLLAHGVGLAVALSIPAVLLLMVVPLSAIIGRRRLSADPL
ncbi:MAG: MFS transporter [Solirubrobacteraceae bacterium]